MVQVEQSSGWGKGWLAVRYGFLSAGDLGGAQISAGGDVLESEVHEGIICFSEEIASLFPILYVGIREVHKGIL